jgi:hypothetical protein
MDTFLWILFAGFNFFIGLIIGHVDEAIEQEEKFKEKKLTRVLDKLDKKFK